MLKKISTKQLAPGMYIADSGIPWIDNPYLYSAECEATPALIAQILSDGYREVFIDPARSRAESLTQDPGNVAQEFGEALAEAPEAEYSAADIPITAEMESAKSTYVRALDQVKLYMDGIRKGDNIDLLKASPVVDEMLKSLGRNPDALLGLCKLRTQDDYTYGHCVNVAVLSVMFAKHMGFPHEIQFASGMAGIFHDLGKALVPLEILNAPRNLSEEEFVILRKHPRLGYEQVKKTPGFNQDILMGIYDHHERFNGTGYPRGISGEAISVTGRILALADVYDALSSSRPYKEAILPHRVLGIMYQMRGEDFFPGYMEHFIRMLGIYPVGSVVELEDGRVGVVSSSNNATPTRPKVLIVRTRDGKPLLPQEKDISTGECPPIQRCLTAEESSVDPAKALNVY